MKIDGNEVAVEPSSWCASRSFARLADSGEISGRVSRRARAGGWGLLAGLLLFGEPAAALAAVQDLEAGGLLPPPPPPPSPAAAQTVRELEQADREDSGRGLQFVWLNPEFGYQWLSLDALSDSDLADASLSTSGGGITFGAGAGVRFLYLTFGARFRYGVLSDFDLWSLSGEVNLRVPRGSFEPYALVAAGYSLASSFAGEDRVFDLGTKRAELSVSGINVRLGGGFDYFLTPVFSVGPRLEGETLFVFRDAVLEPGSGSVYDSDGAGIGLAVSGTLQLGLHF